MTAAAEHETITVADGSGPSEGLKSQMWVLRGRDYVLPQPPTAGTEPRGASLRRRMKPARAGAGLGGRRPSLHPNPDQLYSGIHTRAELSDPPEMPPRTPLKARLSQSDCWKDKGRGQVFTVFGKVPHLTGWHSALGSRVTICAHSSHVATRVREPVCCEVLLE